ncbi:MAG TPA: hypothetical protein VGN72_06545 [Tepidisphaeraceae bacterium]|jgi:hypothetical protein|nr:hypothetical protein [Tepidisphaeraceae bacterium]
MSEPAEKYVPLNYVQLRPDDPTPIPDDSLPECNPAWVAPDGLNVIRIEADSFTDATRQLPRIGQKVSPYLAVKKYDVYRFGPRTFLAFVEHEKVNPRDDIRRRWAAYRRSPQLV